MSSTIQRFIHTDDLTPEHGRRLVEWCVARGGSEFTIRFMGLGDTPGLRETLREALTPFHLGAAKREHSRTLAGNESRRLADNWRLCPDSITLLHHHLSAGLFTRPSYGAAGWLEDFTVYRQGNIMLGVVSHEGVVALRLTEREHREVAELGIQSHETAI